MAILPPAFDEVTDVEVTELMDLLALTPFDEFSDTRGLLLNPVLAHGGVGADVDLLVGSRLVELKTTAKRRVQRETVRQLVGYLLLWELRRAGLRREPLTSLDVYLARFGRWWRLDASTVYSHARYGASLRRFARIVVGPPAPRAPSAR